MKRPYPDDLRLCARVCYPKLLSVAYPTGREPKRVTGDERDATVEQALSSLVTSNAQTVSVLVEKCGQDVTRWCVRGTDSAISFFKGL